MKKERDSTIIVDNYLKSKLFLEKNTPAKKYTCYISLILK